MRRFAITAAICGIAAVSFAEMTEIDGVVLHDYDGTFEEAKLSLTSAIEAQGLKVDHISQVGDMLGRTAQDVGATHETYEDAQVVQFCSAALSNKVMEINPANVAFCPYMIFVYQTKGAAMSVVGYREMPSGEMQEVQELLATIVEETLAF